MIVTLIGGKARTIEEKVYFQVIFLLIHNQLKKSVFITIKICIFNILANFVTTDLNEEPAQLKEEKQKQQRRRSVTFNEEVEVRNLPFSGTVPSVSKYSVFFKIHIIAHY